MSLRKISDLEGIDISKLGQNLQENLNQSLFEISFLSSYTKDNGQNFSYRSMYVTYNELVESIIKKINLNTGVDLTPYVTKTGNEIISGNKTFSTKLSAGYKIESESNTTPSNYIATTNWVNLKLSQIQPTQSSGRIHHIGEVFCMTGQYSGTDAQLLDGRTINCSNNQHSQFYSWVVSNWPAAKRNGYSVTLPNMNGKFIEGLTSTTGILTEKQPGVPSLTIQARENTSTGLINGSTAQSSKKFVDEIDIIGIKAETQSKLDASNGLGNKIYDICDKDTKGYSKNYVSLDTSNFGFNTSTLASKLKTQSTANTVQPNSICMYWYIQID